MKKSIWLFLFGAFQLFAAGPMTHLYFAEKWVEQYSITDEEAHRDFVVGNLFPDICYLAHIPREWTHPSVYSADEILMSRTPFEGGIKLHVFVDKVREAFVERTGIYAHILPFAEGHPATLLKFIEEEILAEFFDGRRYSYCLDWILEEELQLGITENVIHEWHTILRHCMHAKPSWLLWFASSKGMFGVSGSTLYNWSYLLPKLAQEPVFRMHVESLLQHIEGAIRGANYGISVY